MDNTTLLLIEGKHAEYPTFTSALRKKGFDARLTSSGNEALKLLSDGFSPKIVIVNAASLRSSGKRICQSLRAKDEKLPILLIMSEDRDVESVDANLILTLPFTAQKLVNRIKHLLPGDGKEKIQAGPIRLYIDKKMVLCPGKQSRLTPRLVRLLMFLMKHHGDVMERDSLFAEVWETDYTEDTRTLDVHISWLRQAIEEDPDHPKLLKTIRGVGYQLDV
jgi:DNA-binding response OmpR family regulator